MSRCLLVALTLLVAAACARSNATFRSSLDKPRATPMERVLVLANVRSRAFNEEVYRGFEKALQGGFTSCGLQEARVLHTDSLENEAQWKTRVADATAQLKPSAILMIRGVTGDVLVGRYGTNADLVYELKLFEGPEVYWSARVKLTMLTRNLYADDAASGAKFGWSIVRQIEADGLLKGCSWPADA